MGTNFWIPDRRFTPSGMTREVAESAVSPGRALAPSRSRALVLPP